MHRLIHINEFFCVVFLPIQSIEKRIMTVQRTVIRVPSQDAQFVIPGDFRGAQLQTMYAQQISGITNMTFTEEEQAGPSGTERVVTFNVRTGNKG